MGIFGAKEKSPLYHAKSNNQWGGIRYAITEELQKWANDPNCIEQEQCAGILSQRLAKMEELHLEREQTNAAKRKALQEDPFDPRTEISADAQHIAAKIVRNLWTIFVILPFVLGILYALLNAMLK